MQKIPSINVNILEMGAAAALGFVISQLNAQSLPGTVLTVVATEGLLLVSKALYSATSNCRKAVMGENNGDRENLRYVNRN